ncbi:unnamed protein product [Cylindrotheca closterium]|uniref:Uncharacterized protein n=1 Tax=Cylindrotheca closterium TaxID=2856 RepID=A0AAD2PWU2_9STRA|nr:unnamed protein product [Cylindrotheca closterium]
MKEQQKRKLKVLVITMGGDRQENIKALFDRLQRDFEPPVFSPGVSARDLRKRYDFFEIANEVGIIPPPEWEAIRDGQATYSLQKITETFWDCLEGIPITKGRWGSQHDQSLHYSVELWRKAKTINRGRSVLACTFAHLRAMKTFVKDGSSFDLILEDNVRVPIEHCAQRIWETIAASKIVEEHGIACHLRFHGYLGSVTNMKYVYQTHSRKRAYACTSDGDSSASVFPLPGPNDLKQDILDGDLPEFESSVEEQDKDGDDNGEGEDHQDDDNQSKTTNERKPGGNFLWGAYSYWISKEAYESLLQRLRVDVGALLYKGRRARFYAVKPIDKILPRYIAFTFGAQTVQHSTHPSFFRAPMLTSKIHTKWDAEFCKSSDFQLRHIGLDWSDLWLTESEERVVVHYRKTGEWLSPTALEQLQES